MVLDADGASAEADWNTGNLVANGDFSQGPASGLPEGWTTVCPNPAIAPEFKLETRTDGHRVLTAKGTGQKECFGYARRRVHLEGGKTYRLRVQLRTEGLEDLNRHLVQGVFGSFNDGIFSYQKHGDYVIGESRFPGPAKAGNAEVRLYFRFSPAGKVSWERVSLQECEPIAPRPVKIACSWGGGDMAHWSQWLDKAGEKKVALALLPEMFSGKDAKAPEPSNGPAPTLLAQKAKQWAMYVTGSYFEKRGKLVFNTAPLFDRQGRLVGTYSKTHPYEPELDMGVTPGTELPVFDTDFGKLGIMICYDSWFPEVTRLLAYKGAEIVVLPNVGYYPALMPARASDNGVCIAVSSEHDIAGVWDSTGAMSGEKQPDPSRRCRTMFCGYEKDDQLQMIVATVDLNQRLSPAWHGGPMLSAPAARRVRQTSIQTLDEDLAREAKRWWEEENPKAEIRNPKEGRNPKPE
jgi:predicted amidohydrolase